ncbi:hypothetical protein CR513_16775, partial [Mucuna pruriens]
MQHEFLNKDIMTLLKEEYEDNNEWTMLFNGASNTSGHRMRLWISKALEYQAKALKVYGDFMLVIHQFRGEWETRDVNLIPYHSYIKELVERFKKITF